MASDRQNARSTSRIMLYVALALLVVLAVALVGSCQETNVTEDRIAPEETTSGLAPDARPLPLAA